MQLKKIMTPEVEHIHKDASVRDVAQKLKVIDAGMVPTYNQRRPLGEDDHESRIYPVYRGRRAGHHEDSPQ